MRPARGQLPAATAARAPNGRRASHAAALCGGRGGRRGGEPVAPASSRQREGRRCPLGGHDAGGEPGFEDGLAVREGRECVAEAVRGQEAGCRGGGHDGPDRQELRDRTRQPRSQEGLRPELGGVAMHKTTGGALWARRAAGETGEGCSVATLRLPADAPGASPTHVPRAGCDELRVRAREAPAGKDERRPPATRIGASGGGGWGERPR